jgi:hypothetical protein
MRCGIEGKYRDGGRQCCRKLMLKCGVVGGWCYREWRYTGVVFRTGGFCWSKAVVLE